MAKCTESVSVAARSPLMRSVVHNGDPVGGYPGCLNLSFSYIEGESFLMAIKDVAVSSGSACTSASLEPSYVLRALGANDEAAHSSIRFGLGRFTTEGEVRRADRGAGLTREGRLRRRQGRQRCRASARALATVRGQSVHVVAELGRWEMVQEGIDLSTINWSEGNH